MPIGKWRHVSRRNECSIGTFEVRPLSWSAWLSHHGQPPVGNRQAQGYFLGLMSSMTNTAHYALFEKGRAGRGDQLTVPGPIVSGA
jgi:hypothetical protein